MVRLHVRGVLRLGVRRAAGRGAGRARRRVAAVAVGATDHDRRRLVHRLDTGMTRQAAGALRIGLGTRLPQAGRRGVDVVGGGARHETEHACQQRECAHTPT
jgi:hypothetical protein